MGAPSFSPTEVPSSCMAQIFWVVKVSFGLGIRRLEAAIYPALITVPLQKNVSVIVPSLANAGGKPARANSPRYGKIASRHSFVLFPAPPTPAQNRPP